MGRIHCTAISTFPAMTVINHLSGELLNIEHELVGCYAGRRDASGPHSDQLVGSIDLTGGMPRRSSRITAVDRDIGGTCLQMIHDFGRQVKLALSAHRADLRQPRSPVAGLGQPTTAKPSLQPPFSDIGTAAHQLPKHAAAVVLDHQHDWTLVKSKVPGRNPYPKKLPTSPGWVGLNDALKP